MEERKRGRCLGRGRLSNLKRNTTMVFAKAMRNTDQLLARFTRRKRIACCFTASYNTSRSSLFFFLFWRG